MLTVADLPPGFEQTSLVETDSLLGEPGIEAKFSYGEGAEDIELITVRTSMLTDPLDQAEFDTVEYQGTATLMYLEGFAEEIGDLSPIAEGITGLGDFGDSSFGLSLLFRPDNAPLVRVDALMFRKNTVGVFITVFYLDGRDPPMTIGDIANILDERIPAASASQLERRASERMLFPELHESIIQESIVVSPDGRRLAYIAIEGEKSIVVVDGEEGNPYDAISGVPIFSPDSQRLAYLAGEGAEQMVVVDGVEGPPYEGIGPHAVCILEGDDRVCSEILFSPDSQHVAYVALDKGSVFTVIDEQPAESYFSIVGLTYSPDGEKLAFVAGGFGDRVVVGGEEQPEYENILASSLVFSPDGQRLAYVAEEVDQLFVVVDGIEGERYDGVDISSITFSPDSQRFAYFAAGNDGQFAVIDGEAGEAHGAVTHGSLQFSPDSNRVAYAADEGNHEFVVVDGEEGARYDFIGLDSVMFSPDSLQVAYVAGEGEQNFPVVSGEELRHGDKVAIGTATFSPDGEHFAYVSISSDGDRPVLDGVVGSLYEFIAEGPLAFSPDGQSLAFLARRDNQWSVVLDGDEGEPYDIVIPGSVIFDSPDVFHYLAVKGGALYLVEEVLADL
jgi:Tol biopolymer transport system component